MADLSSPEDADLDVQLMHDKLAKIRSQATSKLDNQKNLALVLSAVEENIAEQRSNNTPVAYFVSFLALLDQALDNGSTVQENVAVAAAYFLDTVLPYTSTALLRQNFAEILTKLAPVLTNQSAEPSLIKSSIGALETLLLAQDFQQWLLAGNVSPKRALVGMVELSFDARPKVRKRAQDAVFHILATPPPSPKGVHPGGALCASLALNKLKELRSEASARKKSSKAQTNPALIHTLQFATAVAKSNSWPADMIDQLCDSLLDMSGTQDQFLVGAVFGAFEGLFSSMTNDIDIEKYAKVMAILVDLKPSVDDNHLAASWLAVIATGFEGFAKLAPQSALQQLKELFIVVSEYLALQNGNTIISAAQCMIALISEGFSERFLLHSAAESDTVDDVLQFMGEYVENHLFSIKFQNATKEILEFLTALVYKVRSRANPDFLPALATVGKWRSNELDNFPFNKEAEDFIASFIASAGPEVVLDTLPLNLAQSGPSGPGRAWLLPLLRDNVRGASLQFYQRHLQPIVAVFEEKIAQDSKKDLLNTKVFRTIIDQVWLLLPHFCDLPTDLKTAFSEQYATDLALLLYAQPDLRTYICHGLRLLVESNLAYGNGAMADDLVMQEQFPEAAARDNVQYLASMASNILSVLFNVFSSQQPDSRGFVLDTIDTYLQIAEKSDLVATFDKVCGLLKTAMDEEGPAQKPAKNSADQSSAPDLQLTMMDLVVAMAKYVPPSSYTALLAIFSATVGLQNPLMQKRSYRIILRLSEAAQGEQSLAQYMQDIQKVFTTTISSTHSSARASRLLALKYVVAELSTHDMHFIPAILQEVIMLTKDVNEKSRAAAFELLISMGHKMAAGGVIDNLKTPGFDGQAAPTDADLTQYFTMLSAGLASPLQHMVSAAITAISCVLYEFKDQIPQELLVELCSTVELFLTSKSREIAKSAIGFVKVEVLALPDDMIRQNLPEMLHKLMAWSHEHKGHFKLKVKHIIERLMRKYGADVIEQSIPEEDRKLVTNIRKSRARAKKKEAADTTNAKKFTSAYEEALYDLSEDEEEAEKTGRESSAKSDRFILNTDEPLNLLDRQTLLHISSSKPKTVSKKDVKKRAVDMKNGKIVFKDIAARDEPLASLGGIDAYLDAVKQAPVRGQKNRLKFKKTQEDDWSDDEPAEKIAGAKSRVSKPKQKFKARKKL